MERAHLIEATLHQGMDGAWPRSQPLPGSLMPSRAQGTGTKPAPSWYLPQRWLQHHSCTACATTAAQLHTASPLTGAAAVQWLAQHLPLLRTALLARARAALATQTPACGQAGTSGAFNLSPL